MFSVTKDDTMRSVKNTGQSFSSGVSTAAVEAKEDLQDAAHQAGRKVRNLYNSAIDEVSYAKDTVTTQIRTNPVQSSMIALGLGFILGAFLRR